METTLFIKSAFECVYFINGSFFENPKKIVVGNDEIAFITVMPLSAGILPYTVKLSSKRIYSNCDLCTLITLDENKSLLRFFPRYNYVYSPTVKTQTSAVDGVVAHFLHAVNKGDYALARSYLTPSMSNEVSDDALKEFFAPYVDAIDASGIGLYSENTYLLSNEKGSITPFHFDIKMGFIDDITTQN
ncbi:MAG: hypothetical protein IKC64_03670 [Clostridia bacterium]|nr:hypothetical protein [Clostridia bacterium]